MDSLSNTSTIDQVLEHEKCDKDHLSKRTDSKFQEPHHTQSAFNSKHETESSSTTSTTINGQPQVVTVKCNSNHMKTIDHQELVNKLHGIAISTIACSTGSGTKSDLTDNPDDSVPQAEKNTDLARSVTVNGVIKTPPASPMQEANLPESKHEGLDPLVMTDECGIRYVRYESELQMPAIMALISKDLSEPYSVYTYRYFIHNWPNLCFLVSLAFSLSNNL